MTTTAYPIPEKDATADRPAGSPTVNRLIAGVLFMASATLLGFAAALNPSGDGVGTHTQLGMNACGFLEAYGLPCATCGMTTSFALAAEGRLLAAFINQPAGALLALLTAMLLWISGYALVRGSSLAPLGRALWQPGPVAAMAGFVLLAWAWKACMLAWF